MRYQRYQEIEHRLTRLLHLIRNGRHSAIKLATALRVSRPTVCRDIGALRERGYSIRAVNGGSGWAYELTAESESVGHGAGVSQS